MASTDVRSIVLTLLLIVLVLGAIYLVDPTFFGLMGGRHEGFDATMGGDQNYKAQAGMNETPGAAQVNAVKKNIQSAGGDSSSNAPHMDASGGEGFADLQDVTGPAAFVYEGKL